MLSNQDNSVLGVQLETSEDSPPSFPSSRDFQEVDDMVLEYLLFRGFTRSFRAVVADSQGDRLRAFEVERVSSELIALVTAHDLSGLVALWDFLNSRFFSHLDAGYAATVSALKTRLDRLFLVHAVKSDRLDMVHAFFALHGAEIHARSRSEHLMAANDGSSSNGELGGSSSSGVLLGSSSSSWSGGGGLSPWSAWFALPYVADPANDPTFAAYFSTQWMSSVRTSLFNFLSLVFRATPLPKLLLLEKWHTSQHQRTLRQALADKQVEANTLLSQLAQSEKKVAALLSMSKDLMEFVNRRALDDARSSVAAPLRGGHASVSTDCDTNCSSSNSSSSSCSIGNGSSSGNGSGSLGGANGARLFEEELEPPGHPTSGTTHLFEDDDGSGQVRAARMRQIREAGASVLSLASDCAARHTPGGARAANSAAHTSTSTVVDQGSSPVRDGVGGSYPNTGATEVDVLSAAVSQWLQTLR